MPILTDLHVAVGVDALAPVLREVDAGPGLRAEAEALARAAETLTRPRAVYRWLDVARVEEELLLVTIGDGSSHLPLRLGPLSTVATPARRVLVGVCTVGDALDREVRRLNDAGNPLQAYLLDLLGGATLGGISEALCRLAETEARARGWSVGPCLAPGALRGWPLEEQTTLCELLALEHIGVQVSAAGILTPFKSASSLIGIGPGFTASRVGSSCRYCQHAPVCRRRTSAVAPTGRIPWE